MYGHYPNASWTPVKHAKLSFKYGCMQRVCIHKIFSKEKRSVYNFVLLFGILVNQAHNVNKHGNSNK